MYKERVERDHFLQNQNSSPNLPEKSNDLDIFLQKLVEMLSGIQEYSSPYSQITENPEAVVDEIIKNCSWKAGTISATCSLPGGAIGFFTLLPELVMIFRIQGMMIKDIASVYGKEAQLNRELLLFCLFKHGGAHLFRKFIEETSVKILIRPTTVRAFQSLLQKVGLDISKRVLRKNFTRWVPLAGAAVTGTFAFLDTKAVGKNTKNVFTKEIEFLNPKTDSFQE